MSLSMQLVMLLNTLLTLPLTTVMFPRMSRMAAAGDRQGALKGCAACVRYILAFLIPAVCVGCACPGEIVQLAYGWGLSAGTRWPLQPPCSPCTCPAPWAWG